MKYILLTIIILALSACDLIDSIGDTSRTDAVKVLVTVETVSVATLNTVCSKPTSIACFVNETIYLQGEPATYSLDITVQYLSWADLGDKCGRFTGGPACYEDLTLYMSSNYSLGNEYQTGVIGDMLAEALGIDIGLNRRTQLGHEFLHLMGATDPDWVEGSKHLGSSW